ncbi:MAG: sigma-70 family RNA polymerase sigma factor [Planctomycetes bacterium]|nr:sigma-70 family RNA polymerase sigma factor [Planctomycetota bacterium]
MTDQEPAEFSEPDGPDQEATDKVSDEDPQDFSDSSSADWLKKFGDGDSVAFERLIDQELPRLRRRIEERLGADLRRRIDPSDVLQQAALDVYQLRDDFENRGLPAFRGWLKTITMNNLNRLIEKELAQKRDPRREKRRAMEAGRSRSLDPLGNLSASISSPSAGLHREEALQLLGRCLDMLSDDDREMLRWIDEDDLGYEEAARRLSVNVDAARRRHSRAIARLRKFAETMRNSEGDHVADRPEGEQPEDLTPE